MRVVYDEAGISRSPNRPTLPQIPVSRLVGHEEGPIPLVRFTGDGKYCLTAGHDRTVRLWNPSRLDPAFPPDPAVFGDQDDVPVASLPRALPIQVYEEGIRHVPTALAVDGESTRLMVASERTAILLDTITAKVLRRWHGHTAVINSVDIGRNADVLASASYDATVCLWDGRSNSNRPVQTLKEAKDSVTAVRILEYSIRTASVDGCVRTYDIRKGILQCDDCHSPVTSISHTNKNAVQPCLAISCLDGTIRVQANGENQASFGNISSQELSTPLICQHRHAAGRYGLECCFTADASAVLSGSQDGRAILYDVSKAISSGRNGGVQYGDRQPKSAPVILELVGHTAPTCSVAAHPKAEHNDVVVTASFDGHGVVWASSRDYMRWED